MVYFSLSLCWEHKWCRCLSKGQEAGADVESKPFLCGCEVVSLQHKDQKRAAPPHGVTHRVTAATSLYQELSWGEPMPWGAGEFVLLFSCHLHWGEGRRNHCHYSCLAAGNSCLSSVQSALKQRAECVINVLRGKRRLDTGALLAALIAERGLTGICVKSGRR